MQVMDAEVHAMSEAAFKRTVALIEKHKEDVIKVAEYLLEKETISHTDIANLIGERKFSAGKEYDEYVSTKKTLNAEEAGTGSSDKESAEEPEGAMGVVVPGLA
jgi:AFG3 family protein